MTKSIQNVEIFQIFDLFWPFSNNFQLNWPDFEQYDWNRTRFNWFCWDDWFGFVEFGLKLQLKYDTITKKIEIWLRFDCIANGY